MNLKLKSFYILLAVCVLTNCSPKEKTVKENPQESSKVITQEGSVERESAEKEESKNEQKSNNSKASAKSTTNSVKKRSICSDEEHRFQKGSLLFYNLNINDTYEEVVEKLKQFNVMNLEEIGYMPKELKELGCKSFAHVREPYEKFENEFYIIFKDDKIIRFIMYDYFESVFDFFKHIYEINDKFVSNYYLAQDYQPSYKGYQYLEASLDGVIYRNELYLPTGVYTTIMTRAGYDEYFEPVDRDSDEMFQTTNLYVYDLDIKDSQYTIQKKLDNYGIEYEVLSIPEPVDKDGILVHGLKPVIIKTKDKTLFIMCYEGGIICLDADKSSMVDEEKMYVLMHHFKRKYKKNTYNISGCKKDYYFYGFYIKNFIFFDYNLYEGHYGS